MLLVSRLGSALLGVLFVSLNQANACGCCACGRGAPPARPVAGVLAPSPATAPCCPKPTASAGSKADTADMADMQEAGAPAGQKDDEAKIQTNLAKLNAKDRKLAEAQKFCVIEDENRLGSMGVPAKVMVGGQPVFLCCPGCKKKALADPDRTLAKVKELKAKAEEK